MDKQGTDTSIKKGDTVRILVDTPEGQPVTGVVRVVQDVPGKQIGVELESYAAGGHTLDLLLEPEKVDPETAVRYGRGWWTREENIELIKV